MRTWLQQSMVFLAVCLTTTANCSIVLMKHVPPDHHPPNPNCSSGFTMPLADGVLAVLTGATAVNLHSAASNPRNQGTSFRTFAWIATASAVALLGSATYGAIQRNRCVLAQLHSESATTTQPSNRIPPGSRGGACRTDGSCDGELYCDAPMKTCIPITPNDETLPPSSEP